MSRHTVTWAKKPEWKRTDYGCMAVVGVSGEERFTVQIREQRGFWYSSFGAANDSFDQRVQNGPFVSLQDVKKEWQREDVT